MAEHMHHRHDIYINQTEVVRRKEFPLGRRQVLVKHIQTIEQLRRVSINEKLLRLVP